MPSVGAAPVTSGRGSTGRVIWSYWADLENWPASQRFDSQGHAPGRYTAVVKVNPLGSEAYRALVVGVHVPVGTVVAQLHFRRSDGAPGPVYVMHKVNSDRWNYAIVTPDGRTTAGGDGSLCARCHAEGTADALFGAPQIRSADGGGTAALSSQDVVGIARRGLALRR